jgi:hypothetical protein
MITYIERNGPPEAMSCPAILCDQCLKPITGHGNVMWLPDYDGDTYQVLALAHTHKECTAAFERTHHPDRAWCSEELDQWLAQIAHNFTHPFPAEPNVEYLAPAPSQWRLGNYQRTRP